MQFTRPSASNDADGQVRVGACWSLHHAAAAVRELTPSFRYTFARWRPTVFSLMNSRAAASRLPAPAAMHSRTSASRAVSGPTPCGTGASSSVVAPSRSRIARLSARDRLGELGLVREQASPRHPQQGLRGLVRLTVLAERADRGSQCGAGAIAATLSNCQHPVGVIRPGGEAAARVVSGGLAQFPAEGLGIRHPSVRERDLDTRAEQPHTADTVPSLEGRGQVPSMLRAALPSRRASSASPGCGSMPLARAASNAVRAPSWSPRSRRISPSW